VLKYVPGIWSTSNSGSDGIYLSSRGSNLDATNYDMNGIKLMQDGLPVERNQTINR
jgi:iron complex outermembrane receptor protein